MTELPGEQAFLDAIDASVKQAESLMDLNDLDDVSDEDYEAVQEERLHCGICMTRTVMEAVWPSVEAYIDWLKGQIRV